MWQVWTQESFHRVHLVLNRTLVDSDWRFDNLCGSHLQIQSEFYHECELYPVVTGPELTFAGVLERVLLWLFHLTKVAVCLTKNTLIDRTRTYSLARRSRKMVKYQPRLLGHWRQQQTTKDNLQKTNTYLQITRSVIVQPDLPQGYNYTRFDETSATSLRLAWQPTRGDWEPKQRF